jgi:hypothetical protein
MGIRRNEEGKMIRRFINSKPFEWLMKVFAAIVFVQNGYNTFHEAWLFHATFVETQNVAMLWTHLLFFIVFLVLTIFQWNSYINIGKENTELALRLERLRTQMLTRENEALREINQRMDATLDIVAESFKAKEKQKQEEDNAKPVVPQSNDRLGGVE